MACAPPAVASVAEALSPRAREIVAVARDVLEREGPDALSMRAIATRLGIKAPSLYKHVPDKETLEVALIDEALGEVADAFEAAEREVDDPAWAVAAAAGLLPPVLLVGALVWGFHVCFDRAVGYGLRTRDGLQRA